MLPSGHIPAQIAASDGMHFAFACDQRYAPGLLLGVASLLAHTSGLDGSTIHVIDGGLKASTREKLGRIVLGSGYVVGIKYYRLDAKLLDGVRQMGSSALTYARLFLPDLLPDHDTVVYLDCDVYYGADMRALWHAPMRSMPVSAVRDSHVVCLARDGPWLETGDTDRGLPYFNAGVLKIDLKAWRAAGVSEKCFELALRDPQKCTYWDQTPLNHVLRGKVTWLDGKWNRQVAPSESAGSAGDGVPRDGPVNWHYISTPKPWTRYRPTLAFQFWRKRYARLVPGLGGYKLGFQYWSVYVWEFLQQCKMFPLICRALLALRLYALIPGLTRAKLKAHVAHRLERPGP